MLHVIWDFDVRDGSFSNIMRCDIMQISYCESNVVFRNPAIYLIEILTYFQPLFQPLNSSLEATASCGIQKSLYRIRSNALVYLWRFQFQKAPLAA